MANPFGEGAVKMGFLTSGVFWGVVLILLGLSVVVKAVFHIDIPLFRILFALVVIYLGVRVLVGGFGGIQSRHSVVFGERDMRPVAGTRSYAVVFGQGALDLSGEKAPESARHLEFNTVFGSGRLILPRDVPVRVKASAVFGNARFPNGNNVAFGDHVYQSDAWNDGRPGLEIEATVVFGELVIRVADGPAQPATEPTHTL